MERRTDSRRLFKSSKGCELAKHRMLLIVYNPHDAESCCGGLCA